MKNDIVNSIKSDSDFYVFMQKFKQNIENYTFPDDYNKRRLPEERKKDFQNKEVQNIIERELIRDNIYYKYGFDIFKLPFVVFHQNEKSKEILKGFKSINEATQYSKKMLGNNIHSILISIMNHQIECAIFN